MKKQLHPGARWLFRMQAFWGIVFLSIFLGFFVFPFIFSFSLFISDTPNILGNFLKLFLLWIFSVIVLMIVVEIWVRMSYNRWFYEFTESNLKQERGVIWKTYSNLPYERIQNVDIRRGIIARVFGFSSLNIQTAGYSSHVSGAYGYNSEGYIPAVDMNEAERVRDFLMKKLSGRKHGL